MALFRVTVKPSALVPANVAIEESHCSLSALFMAREVTSGFSAVSLWLHTLSGCIVA